MGTRRKSRELALQMLFQADMGKQTIDHVKKTFWAERRDLEDSVRNFADDIFRVAMERYDEIGTLLEGHTEHWRLERMAAVDRNILRAGVAEFLGFPKHWKSHAASLRPSRFSSSMACWILLHGNLSRKPVLRTRSSQPRNSRLRDPQEIRCLTGVAVRRSCLESKFFDASKSLLPGMRPPAGTHGESNSPWEGSRCFMDFSRIEPKYIVLAVVVIAAIVLAGIALARRRQAASARIRQRFGPEYDRTVQASGSERRAEAQLAHRTERVETLNIRELAPTERERFTQLWNALQMRFVDSPKGAVAEADDLLVLVMQARGYPMSDFEQRAADLSVNYPVVVDNYRSGHAIASQLGNAKVSTEDMRRAMIHFRALFDEMVQIAPSVARRDVA